MGRKPNADHSIVSEKNPPSHQERAKHGETLSKKELRDYIFQQFTSCDQSALSKFLEYLPDQKNNPFESLDLERNTLPAFANKLEEAIQLFDESSLENYQILFEYISRKNPETIDHAEKEIEASFASLQKLKKLCASARVVGRKPMQDESRIMWLIAEFWEKRSHGKFTQGFVSSKANPESEKQYPVNDVGLFTYLIFLYLSSSKSEFDKQYKPSFTRKMNEIVRQRKLNAFNEMPLSV